MEFYSRNGFWPIFLYWPYKSVYITDILLVFIQNTAIIKEGIFLEELSFLNGKTVFVYYLRYVISCLAYS